MDTATSPDFVLISASLLAADAAILGKEAQDLEKAGVDWLHWDIMDGQYVPNFSFGPSVMHSVKRCCALPFDVHLMIQHPETYFDLFTQAGAHSLTFHPHSTQQDPGLLLQGMNNVYKGLAVSPDQDPLSWPDSWWENADLALIMTVVPGFCGQSFLASALSCIALLKKRFPHLLISVDGGITPITATLAVDQGADILVTGSYLFSENNYATAVHRLKNQQEVLSDPSI